VIAATAVALGLALVARNLADFNVPPLRVVTP